MTSPLLLLVDDDALLRTRMAGLATQVGFRVVQAGDGLEGLQVFDATRPDLVITDFHMPGLDGKGLVTRLRDHPQGAEIPIMVITADGSRRTKISLLELGADDFLHKPVDPMEFKARLASMARRSALVGTLELVTSERDEANRRLQERTRELERLTYGLVAALERANTLNDSDTGNHIRRVSGYAAMLAQAYGCDASFTEEIYRYAGLHDVGKVGIPDAILKKPGRLTQEEFDQMKVHTLIGAELLRDAGLPACACNIALSHHERWDGRGYPHGMGGEAIPLEARLVSVADVFDALVTRRCYKASMSFDQARAIMEEGAGTQLDPRLVELFFAHEDDVVRIFSEYADEPLDVEAWE